MKRLFLLCGGLLAFIPVCCGQDLLDRLGDALNVSSANGNVRARLSGLLDVEGYYFEHPAPGLIDTTDQALFNPRLTLFLDGQVGSTIYFFAQARLDRGFDASDHGPRVGMEEYALRYTPWEDGRLSVQIGKVATVFGIWTGRHLSWDNPLIGAPLPYENVTAVSDAEPPLAGRGAKLDAEEKYEYLPVIWGPSYTTGLTIAGRIGRLDYAAELKNASLSSQPEAWSATEVGFDHPTFNGRVGYRPNVAWNFGVSASAGAYLAPEAKLGLPRGKSIGDYQETVFGQDLGYAAGHWQFWDECFESRFEVPELGNLDAFSYYLEAKYKFTPQFSGAVRWNQQTFSEGQGAFLTRDTWRADAAAAYRFTPHLQIKLQYSFQDGDSEVGQGSAVSSQLTLRF